MLNKGITSMANNKALNVLIILFFCFLFLPNHSSEAVGLDEQVRMLTSKANTYSRQGNHLMAMKLTAQAMKLKPNDMSLFYNRAFLFGRAGHYANAVKDFSLVINQGNNRFPHALRFRADCYVVLGYLQYAINDYTVFLRFAPNDGKVWSYLVEALALRKQTRSALQAVRQGIATNSHWTDRLELLQKQLLTGEKITPHRPLSN